MSNESAVVENGDFRFFRSLYLPNLHILKPHLLYCTIWPISDASMIPKLMTLNGHFALKSVSARQLYNGLASPALGQNCSKICRATHILLATTM